MHNAHLASSRGACGPKVVLGRQQTSLNALKYPFNSPKSSRETFAIPPKYRWSGNAVDTARKLTLQAPDWRPSPSAQTRMHSDGDFSLLASSGPIGLYHLAKTPILSNAAILAVVGIIPDRNTVYRRQHIRHFLQRIRISFSRPSLLIGLSCSSVVSFVPAQLRKLVKQTFRELHDKQNSINVIPHRTAHPTKWRT
jgi:hypothetical protein